LFRFYQQVIALRKSEKALQYGTIRMYAKEGVVYLIRDCRGSRLVTMLNNTDTEKSVSLQEDYEVLLCTEEMEKNVLRPFSGCICRLV
jgi:hypothetical protein